MRIIYSVSLSVIIGAFTAGNAHAADNLGDLDVTIRVIDSKQNINEFINRIELPKGVVETPPAAIEQTSVSTAGSSKTDRQSENASSNRRDSGKNKDHRQNNNERDGDNNRQSNRQTESVDPDRSSTVDKNQRDSTDQRDRAGDTREQRDNTRERQESAQDTSRNNWDKFRDSYPPSKWPERPK